MNETIGKRIARMRKEKDLRQEDLAERLGVSAQAVSKWENDISCPDISVLPQVASILGITVDELLTGKKDEPLTAYVPESERKSVNDLTLRILVNSADGDRVKVNLPMALVRACIEMGVSIDNISGGKTKGKDIDWTQIMNLIENGVVGKLVEIESSDGDTVEIVVE